MTANENGTLDRDADQQDRPSPSATALCIHCKAKKIHRPRGLCVHCYENPRIREQYPPARKFCNAGLSIRGAGTTPLPTPAAPGSPEKITVLQSRAQVGHELWHSQDAKQDDVDA